MGRQRRSAALAPRWAHCHVRVSIVIREHHRDIRSAADVGRRRAPVATAVCEHPAMTAAPRPRSDLDLAALLARTMFTSDLAGRMIAINERPPLRRPPRAFVAWTPRGAIVRVRDDVPAAVAARLQAMIAAEPVHATLPRVPHCLAAVQAALAEHAPVSAAAGEAEAGPEYRFPGADEPSPPLPALDASAELAAVTEASSHVFARWLPAWCADAEIGLPTAAVIVDGHAVAVCATVRLPGEAVCAGVETHAAFRGRGYAAAATAAWARAVRERDLVPLYGTSWTNLASQRVAAKLGLIPYCGSLSLE